MGIADWYNAICSAAIQKTCPIFLMQAGLPEHPSRIEASVVQSGEYNQVLLDLFTWAAHPSLPTSEDDTAEATFTFPDSVAAVNFWVLSANPDSPHAPFAWFNADLPRLSVAEKICAGKSTHPTDFPDAGIFDHERLRRIAHPIRHYLLIDEALNGNLAEKMQKLSAFVHQYRPTLGFSFSEARLAVRVTIAMAPEKIPPDLIDSLKQSGCEIDWLA